MSEESENPHWNVSIKEIREREDGSYDVTMDVPDDFKVWFMEWQGLKRWSEKRFQKIMSSVIKEHIIAHNQAKEKENEEQSLMS